jgi:hypothetical protein
MIPPNRRRGKPLSLVPAAYGGPSEVLDSFSVAAVGLQSYPISKRTSGDPGVMARPWPPRHLAQ